MPVVVPQGLQRRYRGTAAGRTWLASLQPRMEQALIRFGAEPVAAVVAEAWHGQGALVVPVVSAAGPAVLKFPYPHPEAAAEAAALTLWNGRGAVRLLQHDPEIGCLLLERLDERNTLLDADMDLAVAEWGRLVRLLGLPAGEEPEWAAFASIAERAEQLSDEIPADWDALGEPFERWLMEAALEVSQTRGVLGRRSSNDVLVHADLHFGNILFRPPARHASGGGADGGGRDGGGDRDGAGAGAGADDDGGAGSYAAIDPQAFLGEREFAVAPMLWNRLDELDPAAPEAALGRRLDALCRAGGLDRDAAAQWAVLREVRNALEYLQEGAAGQAQRSLWVASALVGREHPGLPPVHLLPAP